MAELERRLRARAQDSAAVIRHRMENAVEEISHALEFDYVIINKVFEEARRDLAAVVRAARLTLTLQTARNPGLLNLTGKT
jgi:guanylate kinase